MTRSLYILRYRLDSFEQYITLRWNKWSDDMRQLALTSRSLLIKDLQRQQLKEFRYD